MYYIVGDIGNTSTRICLFKNQKLLKSIIFDTEKLLIKGFIKKNLEEFKKKLKKEILFSSVVPRALKKLKMI